MSKDYSEYKASKYDEYLKVRTPENGSVIKVFNNKVNIDCDCQTVDIIVDCGNEYFNEKFHHLSLEDEFNTNVTCHRDKITEIKKVISDISDYEKTYLARQKLNRNAGKISFDFMTEERIRKIFYYFNPNITVPSRINIFSNSSIRLDLCEGIFDFIYADFITPLVYLVNIYNSLDDKSIFSSDDSKIYNDKQKEYRLLLDYEKTIELIKPLLYASIYSGICPPRFDFEGDFIEQLIWYGNYLVYLQREYEKLIQFCYDEEYHPELFLGSNPKSRYYLYKVINGLPTESFRKEVMSWNNTDSDGNFRLTDSEYYDRYHKDLFNREYTLENIDFIKESDLNAYDVTGILSSYRNITEGYVFGTVDEILELEFTKMLKSNIRIKKCKRCGKYFRLKGNYHTDYCSRIAEGEGRNCREIAASEKYKSKMANNQALKIYNKYYKRYMARVKVNQLKEEKFLDWQYESLSMRDACEREVITVKEYIDFNESFFPNRKKKETK